MRRTFPRFIGNNYAHDQTLVDAVRGLAADKGCTTALVALAWVHAKGEDIFPIPGTNRRRFVEENAAAVDIALSADEVAILEASMAPDVASGTRYPEASMARLHL
mgnify:CR=1 FL=1